MSALASCVFFRVREVLVLSPRGRKEGEERVRGKAEKYLITVYASRSHA